jgi:type I restriction enzyme, R subunit
VGAVDPGRDDLEEVTARFNDPADPLKIIIVTAKLLTGFDAPILYAQYLDKPLKEHTLLQAITRTNRVYPGKTHGLVVDYLGVFDNVAKAFKFDEFTVKQIITNIAELKAQLKPAIDAALAFFPGAPELDVALTRSVAACQRSSLTLNHVWRSRFKGLGLQ